MMKDMTVSKALKWIFIAQILGLFAWVPVVGLILAIVGFVMNLLALHGASKLEAGYHTAFILSVAGIVVSIIAIFANKGVLGSIVSIISTIISLGIIYYIINTTNGLLRSGGHEDIAVRGDKVWKINLYCTIAAVVLTIIAVIAPVLGVILSVVVAIVEIVGYVLYLIYLNKSYNVL